MLARVYILLGLMTVSINISAQIVAEIGIPHVQESIPHQLSQPGFYGIFGFQKQHFIYSTYLRTNALLYRQVATGIKVEYARVLNIDKKFHIYPLVFIDYQKDFSPAPPPNLENVVYSAGLGISINYFLFRDFGVSSTFSRGYGYQNYKYQKDRFAATYPFAISLGVKYRFKRLN